MKVEVLWNKRNTAGKEFTMNVLNTVAWSLYLSPGALLGELVKALLPVFPQGQLIIQATQVANTLIRGQSSVDGRSILQIHPNSNRGALALSRFYLPAV